MDNIKVYASEYASGRTDDPTAVMAVIRQGPQMIISMSIAQARDISNQLARAADDAELKLKD